MQQALGTIIQTDLSDPRIKGLISVTRVEMTPDLREGRVFLSFLGVTPEETQLGLQAIRHARGHIQSRLGTKLTMRVCPILHFELDDSLKEGFKVLQLLDQVAAEHLPKPAALEEEDEEDDDEGQQ